MAKDGRICLGIPLALVAFGCGSKPAPAYPDYAPATSPAVLSSDNGFTLYVQAADDVEARGSNLKTRVSLTGKDKEALFAATEPAIKLLDKGSAMNVAFAFEPHKPFVAPSHQVGWRLLSRSLTWHIGDACAAGQFDPAIGYVLLATKVGFDLVGGGATDASLGLSIVDDARRAVIDYLPQFSPEQLHKLSDGLQKVLHSKPELSRTIGNEKQNMMEAIAFVQDAYKGNNYDVLVKKLGSDVRDAVKHLQEEVKPKDEIERPKYFEGFAKEADDEVKWEIQMAAIPASQRATSKGPVQVVDRPWKRWAKYFFLGGRPLLAMYDASVARTRLLALDAQIVSLVKANKKAPSSLSEFPPDLIQDPFTGGTFIYRAEGMTFKVYSAGDNFRDDGGQTDGAFARPDLTLESRG